MVVVLELLLLVMLEVELVVVVMLKELLVVLFEVTVGGEVNDGGAVGSVASEVSSCIVSSGECDLVMLVVRLVVVILLVNILT